MGMEPIVMRQGELESWKQGRRVEVKTKILKHPALIHGEKIYHLKEKNECDPVQVVETSWKAMSGEDRV